MLTRAPDFTYASIMHITVCSNLSLLITNYEITKAAELPNHTKLLLMVNYQLGKLPTW